VAATQAFHADGSRSTVSVFDYNGRLYQLEAKALPGASDGPADTVRFEQSLVFTDGGSNRSEDTIRAIREGCHSDALNGAGNPSTPQAWTIRGAKSRDRSASRPARHEAG
jgi:hypothetical protein